MPPPPLPIDEALPRFLTSLAQHSAVVLVAPAGAGKSTRAPAAMLDAKLAGEKQILVLQPRRMAARAVARRIAYERGSNLGGEIGFQVRFERQAGTETRLLVVTEGVALRMLHDDPFLERVGAIVFDEFHERSLNTDLALGMARRVQQTLRPDLKLVLMSATIDGAEAANLLGGCPVVESHGRAFPVEIRHTSNLTRQTLAEAVASGVLDLLGETSGHVLAFLPGMREIRQAAARLSSQLSHQACELHILHGDLPAEKQDAALAPSSQRKVILATNVAETSLTIDGVTAVVDTGLARQSRYDPRTGLNRLELTTISQAAADQRAGRAGRTAPGVCLRLWPAAAHRARPAQERPEIVRVDLAGALLQILCWEDPQVADFPWIESPRPAAVASGLELLRRLGAIDDLGGATPLGRRMVRLPAHPRIARLLLEGRKLDIAFEAATAAALLSERDPFRSAPSPVHSSGDCDLAERIERLPRIGNAALRRGIEAARDQFLRELRTNVKRNSFRFSSASLSKALLTAFPDRVARRRAPGDPRGLMVAGAGVRLAPESVVRESEFLLCLDVEANRAKGAEAIVRIASSIERQWLDEKQIRVLREATFDEASERVIGRRRVYYLDLPLEESPDRLDDPEQTADQLAAEAHARWPAAFPQSDSGVASFVRRVRWLGEWLPDLKLPSLDESQLKELLPRLAVGRRSFAELRGAPWLEAVRGLLTYEQLATVDREAPERLTVPSGSRIEIVYCADRPPILAVRIQELFGMQETPRLARGRAPVLLHLLAPNMRPQQVTADLASFWKNTYPQVRKDLRGRYPKHSWPEDPLAAEPLRGAKRRE